MRTKLKLTIDVTSTSLQSSDLSVLGIVANYNNFTFVARVNRFSKFNFYKSCDFALWKKNKKDNDYFTAYHYRYNERHCDLIIVNTKNNNQDTFINNWKDFNYILIVVGRDNKIVSKEVLENIKANINYGKILSLEKETVVESVNKVVQMDIFSETQNVKTVKTTKQGISAETLDNFFIAVEDYLTNLK